VNTQPSKLCLVIPSLQVGGMERVMSELSHFFCENSKNEVHLVLFGINPELFYNVPNNLIIHKPRRKSNNKFRLLSTLGRMYYLRKRISEIDPNSILSFGEKWNSFVLLALIGLKYHILVSDRCSPDKKLGFFHESLRKLLYPHSSGVIVQTHIAKMIYERLLRNVPISVIGNPIRQVGLNPQQPKGETILTISRIIPSKNHKRVIELFLKIKDSNWKLVIVGGNALKMNLMEELKTLVKDLNAEDRVVLMGARQNVDTFYHTSKIFIFASESEGFPNVIGEAMSAGLPVIAFNCVAGPSEMITDGKDGFLIPVNDYEMMETRLQELMDDPLLRKRIGSAAMLSIEKYSVDKIGEKYYSLLGL
jgi:GalNAc-alpha-(1->4)-GalNAc-alpha-(1->3)-diNAcBac-PP-undecaprenol alpha-1,4-N-acetyl-D-galactosaminyltransferase